ncbi:DUF559 domain-containing protein [soil metagenome]
MRRKQSIERRQFLDRIALRQQGRIKRAQLIELGFTPDQVDGMVERRELVVEHRGVYAVGHAPQSLAGRAAAATLAYGQNAVASFFTAARLQRLLRTGEAALLIDVTIPSRGPRSRRGVRVHFCDNLAPADRRIIDGVPVTSPARTLLDIAARAPEDVFEAAFDEAVFRKTVTPSDVIDVLSRNAGRAGTARLRTLHQADASGERNRREAEKRMAKLIRAAKLPPPRANARIGPYTVDFVWPEHHFVLEMDGFSTHSRRSAFEADRARDADLQSRGYLVMRVTWRQLTREPAVVVARLAAGLAQAATRRDRTEPASS